MPHTDAAFAIGKTHKVCQDYAITGGEDGIMPSVWLSDGCSSSPHTDIGARLLTHLALDRVSDFGTVAGVGDDAQPSACETFVRDILTRAARIARDIGVADDCLNATLIGLVDGRNTEGDRSLHAIFYGDGALVYGFANGERVVFRSAYPANFPFYPAYLADARRRQIWERVHNNRQAITRTVLDAEGRVQESETSCSESQLHMMIRPVAGLRWAAILSDGIESFQERVDGESSCSFSPVDYLDVVRHLTAFKNFAGEFVHRRLQSFAKECARRGWHHNDDISIAALYFGTHDGEG